MQGVNDLGLESAILYNGHNLSPKFDQVKLKVDEIPSVPYLVRRKQSETRYRFKQNKWYSQIKNY